jgi:hypothetical protein
MRTEPKSGASWHSLLWSHEDPRAVLVTARCKHERYIDSSHRLRIDTSTKVPAWLARRLASFGGIFQPQRGVIVNAGWQASGSG